MNGPLCTTASSIIQQTSSKQPQRPLSKWRQWQGHFEELIVFEKEILTWIYFVHICSIMYETVVHNKILSSYLPTLLFDSLYKVLFWERVLPVTKAFGYWHFPRDPIRKVLPFRAKQNCDGGGGKEGCVLEKVTKKHNSVYKDLQPFYRCFYW